MLALFPILLPFFGLVFLISWTGAIPTAITLDTVSSRHAIQVPAQHKSSPSVIPIQLQGSHDKLKERVQRFEIQKSPLRASVFGKWLDATKLSTVLQNMKIPTENKMIGETVLFSTGVRESSVPNMNENDWKSMSKIETFLSSGGTYRQLIGKVPSPVMFKWYSLKGAMQKEFMADNCATTFNPFNYKWNTCCVLSSLSVTRNQTTKSKEVGYA